MDKVRKTFDKWAQNGRAELMEIEHGRNVSKFLQSISFDKSFTFLDFGCGNGWVVKKISKESNFIRILSRSIYRHQKKCNQTKNNRDWSHKDQNLGLSYLKLE